MCHTKLTDGWNYGQIRTVMQRLSSMDVKIDVRRIKNFDKMYQNNIRTHEPNTCCFLGMSQFRFRRPYDKLQV